MVSGFQVICDRPCIAIDSDKYWEQEIQNTRDSIIFIDEYNHKWIKSEDFARAIKGSQNYYVIVQRSMLGRLRNKPWISIDTGVLHNCTDSEIKQTLNTFISDINI